MKRKNTIGGVDNLKHSQSHVTWLLGRHLQVGHPRGHFLDLADILRDLMIASGFYPFEAATFLVDSACYFARHATDAEGEFKDWKRAAIDRLAASRWSPEDGSCGVGTADASKAPNPVGDAPCRQGVISEVSLGLWPKKPGEGGS